MSGRQNGSLLLDGSPPHRNPPGAFPQHLTLTFLFFLLVASHRWDEIDCNRIQTFEIRLRSGPNRGYIYTHWWRVEVTPPPPPSVLTAVYGDPIIHHMYQVILLKYVQCFLFFCSKLVFLTSTQFVGTCCKCFSLELIRGVNVLQARVNCYDLTEIRRPFCPQTKS